MIFNFKYMKNGNLIKILSTIFVVLSIFSYVFFVLEKNVFAQSVEDFNAYNSLGGGSVVGNYIKVGDQWVLKSSMSGRIESIKNSVKEIFTWTDKWGKDTAAALAFKSGIKMFFNQLAYDTATYLATGDKGQAPMFQTDSFGGFLKNAADYAAGDFLEAFGQSGALGIKFNVCDPDPEIKLMIGLGLYQQRRPSKPDCTFSEMKNNWEETLQDPNFLNRFQAVFDPRQNDLGIALTMQTGMEDYIAKKTNEAEKEYLSSDGWKAVKDKISGAIKTPSRLVGLRAEEAFKGATVPESTFTGNLIADTFDTFVNTLMGKLIEKWFKNGLVLKFPNNSYDWSGVANYFSGSYKEGLSGAKDRFLNISETSFNIRGDYEVLGELTACPDPQKAGPTNCVITEKFRQAVAEKFTVGDARSEGYLNSAGIFGFNADGLEPNFNEGYPYRSMLILRKFRIIPVGWELAAEYINNNQKTVGAKNLGDLLACFSNDPNDGFVGYYENWCEGLVDPNWVLKAPLNFCKKEGYGPEITTSRVMGTGKDSELIIGRNDNYCADEQACIKENDDGSCELYGYCTEEKRKWDFNADSCDPVYNTCQTFKNKNGQNYSYLENTLDYSGCDADNVGCTEYCRDYDINIEKYTCDANSGSKTYFDASAGTCNESAEGCHEFIRTKSGSGANLFPNSSFEEATTWPQSNEESFSGQYSVKLGAYIPGNDTLLEISDSNADLASLPITFSLYMKGCGAGVTIAVGTGQNGLVLSRDEKLIDTTDSEWRRYEVTHFTPYEATRRQIFFDIEDYQPNCFFDAVKVEFGEKATAYSDYRTNGLVYEKIIPDYLKDECYTNPSAGNYSLKSGYPSVCDNYSRLCDSGEVGCTMYKAEKDGMSIPARVTQADYCPSECVGYDEYHQMSSTFDSQRPFYFVPSSATKCSNAAVGCDEFTNLDKLGQGAEAREYYSELKQCRKPDSECREFYVWEGSGDTGFQLRVYQMETDNLAPYGPKQTRNIVGECDATIYALPATDPAYNPDCREFYNKDGETTYRLYSRTISCSDNCHPYRRSENNILENTAEARILCEDECGVDAACIALCAPIDCESASNGKVCEFDNGTSAFCKNGGLWNSQHGRCLYNAIPGDGQKCADSQAGCREYSGASGNNISFVMNTDIESGTTENWEGDLLSADNPSSESLIAGGHSLSVSGPDYQIAKELGNVLEKGKSYSISFIAKKNSAGTASRFTEIGFGLNSVSVGFEMGGAENYELGNEWRLYRFNLTELNNTAGNYAIDNEEKIFIKADGAFYIDNIRLSEITDRYFLIKNSWEIDACLYDVSGQPQGSLYNLGCAAYRDDENIQHNLRKFTMLCQDSAVGCELMIDTHNSSAFASSTSLTGIMPVVDTSQDSFVYVVYNKKMLCNKSDKGCERLGKPYQYGSVTLYSHAYLKNDPDNYGTILCDQGAAKCESWTANSGISYFKDPGDQICDYRTKTGDNSPAWYKKHVKRCDLDGNGTISGVGEIGDANVCRDENDCSSDIACLDDDAEYECDITTEKTIGFGGSGGRIEQPTNGWVGLCPAGEAGCSEYVDPLSRFSGNIIFNPKYENLGGGDGSGWTAGTQALVLKPYTLYVLRSSDLTGSVSITDCNDVKILNNYNILINSTPITDESNVLFLTGSSVDCKVNGGQKGKTIELKEAIVDYQIKQKIDKTTCNGLVDFEKGCVLLNERSVSGGDGISVHYSGLTWDANATFKDDNGIAPLAGTSDDQNDSLALVKASPDRTCKTWLSCQSFIKDENNNNVCFDVGLCDKFDSNGNCANAVEDASGNQMYTAGVGSYYGDFTGYVKVGYGNDDKVKRNDYFSLGNMKQDGQIAKVPNGDFEIYGSNAYPLGWSPKSDSWTEDKFKAINNPWEAEKEGVKYPISGKSFLKYSPQLSVVESEFIDILPGEEYVFSVMMNTMNFAGDKTAGDNDLTSATLGIETYSANGELTDSYNYNGVDLPVGMDITYCTHQPLGEGCGIYLSERSNWTNIKGKFTVSGRTAKIKLKFSAQWHLDFDKDKGVFDSFGYCTGDKQCIGSVYADDIKIYPALNAYQSVYESPVAIGLMDMEWLTNRWKIDWLKEKSCRLYPEDESLSCEYLNDSGVKKKGLYGYCLEYDRYPGNKDACLLWYPIDKVKGDGIEEGAGYLGKYPVYYCVEKQDLIKLEKRKYITNGVTTGCDWDSPPSPSGNYGIVPGSGRAVGQCSGNCDDGDSNYTSAYAPNKAACIYECQDNGTGWYIHDGFENFNSGHCCPTACDTIDEAKDGLKYYDTETKMVFDDFSMKCTKVLQTVTPIGQNKYWSGRVYKGSNYQSPCNIGISELDGTCVYTSDAEPFGSVVPPGNTWSEATNPYEWTVPLYFRLPASEKARMGQLQSIPNVQQLFAKSYGEWQWNPVSSRYEKTNGGDWGPPNAICLTEPRNEGEYCYISPKVSNLKSDKGAINNIGYINLTFNSKADSQQLPLVMYSVNWGDGENTTVTGVEMRDRPNEANPHSLYHLYNYWDLRKKFAMANKPAGLDCLTDSDGTYCKVKITAKVKDNWDKVSAEQTISIRAYLNGNLVEEAACVPKTCADLGKQCGSWPDNCGGTVKCPDCGVGETCSNGQCGSSCVFNCSSSIGCSNSVPGNSYNNGANCCGTGLCYECNAGYAWDGSACQVIGSGCSDECANGAKQCSGANAQTCGNYDGDSCLEWGNNIVCADSCSNGVCVGNNPCDACDPTWQTCVSGSCIAQTCNMNLTAESPLVGISPCEWIPPFNPGVNCVQRGGECCEPGQSYVSVQQVGTNCRVTCANQGVKMKQTDGQIKCCTENAVDFNGVIKRACDGDIWPNPARKAYLARITGTGELLDCLDTSPASTWYKAKGRCGEPSGIAFWNARTQADLNIAWDNYLNSSCAGNTLAECLNFLLCSKGGVYSPNTNFCYFP